MATYNYLCRTCKVKAEEIKGAELTTDELWEVIFETVHPMMPTKKELRETTTCPRCEGRETEKTMLGVCPGVVYVRGNGYLDRAGCNRAMHLHHLKTDDPYGEHRVSGEVDDIEARLKRAGQHNPNTQYFRT